MAALSVVIPVYNSAALVGATIDRVVAVCRGQGWSFELVLVDDASPDASLSVLRDRARRYEEVRAIALPVNGGQHAALLAGLRASSGEVVVCMDDDLQHPPEAIPILVAAVDRGHDAVFARFTQPRHAAWRRPGSLAIRLIDRLVFGAPAGLAISSFRVLRRPVVDRVCAYRGAAPYIRGQILRASEHPGQVDVPHAPRLVGASSYTPAALAAFVARIVIEWSRLPAYAALAAGAAWLGTAAAATSAFGGPSVRGLVGLAVLHGGTLSGLGFAGLLMWRPQEGGAARVEAARQAAHVGGRGMQQRQTGIVGPVAEQAGAAALELDRQPSDAAGRDEGPTARARVRDQQDHEGEPPDPPPHVAGPCP